jgi:hypothetical protein
MRRGLNPQGANPGAAFGGAGLGLRRALMGPLAETLPDTVDFLEVAPENWIGVGGRLGRELRFFAERYPMVAHGLSLSLGGPHPLDEALLGRIKAFLDAHGFAAYSEHLSYTADDGQLYDLLPIPFTEEAVRYVAERIRRAQAILERPVAVENVSYYAAPGKAMAEIDFLNAVLAEADCQLLLDVNNVYVNAVNHGYDPHDFLARLPGERVAYIHVAGHFAEAEDLLIDTHGAPVVDPVWDLLDAAYGLFGPRPTLLERDTHIPPLNDLLGEVATIHRLQAANREPRHAVAGA